jgi:hypothetical protein
MEKVGQGSVGPAASVLTGGPLHSTVVTVLVHFFCSCIIRLKWKRFTCMDYELRAASFRQLMIDDAVQEEE